jgi:hypothetical protein
MSDQPNEATGIPPQAEHPAHDDRRGWRTYWLNRGQPWRVEPEIDQERQAYLSERQAITPDLQQGIYPFRDVKLTLADVEWLLATHEDYGWRGPVDWCDEYQQARDGLDLRGADVRQVNLSALPLARLIAGVPDEDQATATPEQREWAAAHLRAPISVVPTWSTPA